MPRTGRMVWALVAAVVIALSGAARAGSLLADYDLIVAENVGASGSHVQRLAMHGDGLIGGSVYGGQNFAVGHVNGSVDWSKVVTHIGGSIRTKGGFNAKGTVFVDGSITTNGGYVEITHRVYYGGSFNANTNSSHLLTKYADATVPLPVMPDIQTELTAASSFYASQQTSGTASATLQLTDGGKKGTIHATGQGVAIVNTDIATLEKLTEINLSADFIDTVVLVNIVGTPTLSGGAVVDPFDFNVNMNGQTDESNWVWNFTQAQQLALTRTWRGTILAPNATLNSSNGDIHGTIAVKAIGAFNGQHHPDTPTLIVPTPSAAFGAGALLLALAARRRPAA